MVILDKSLIQDFTTGIIAIIVISVIQLLLFILSAISAARSQKSGLVKLNWIIFQLIFPVIGPIVYFIFGREKRTFIAQSTFKESATVSRPSQKLESIFKNPEANLAKSVTINQTEDTQQTAHLGTGSIFEQEKAVEFNARLQQAIDYVKTNIAKGFSTDKIKEALRKTGWDEEDIARAVIEAQKK